MGKVKRLELWWQLYRTSLPVWDLENFRPMDFCWHECTVRARPVTAPLSLLCLCGFDSLLTEKQTSISRCWWNKLAREVWSGGANEELVSVRGGEMGIGIEWMLLIQLYDTCNVIWPKEIRTLMCEMKWTWTVLVTCNHTKSAAVAPAQQGASSHRSGKAYSELWDLADYLDGSHFFTKPTDMAE